VTRGERGAHRGQAIKPEATIAAEMAMVAVTGHEYRGNPTQRISNGSVGVPSVLLKPIAVTRENVASVIIAGGFYTVEKVCTTETNPTRPTALRLVGPGRTVTPVQGTSGRYCPASAANRSCRPVTPPLPRRCWSACNG
jgi:hypothetical protein